MSWRFIDGLISRKNPPLPSQAQIIYRNRQKSRNFIYLYTRCGLNGRNDSCPINQCGRRLLPARGGIESLSNHCLYAAIPRRMFFSGYAGTPIATAFAILSEILNAFPSSYLSSFMTTAFT
jgi:hypothetical protein